MGAAAVIDKELVLSFGRDGFVVVPDLLEPAELDHFGPRIDAAVAARTRDYQRTLAERTPYEQSFLQCINLWEDCEDVRPLTFHPRIACAAAELLGVERLRLWHDQALYKEPAGRETDAHQDQPYWPIVETDTVTAWIPFDDVREENGQMGYVPGSHRFGVRKFVNIFLGKPHDILSSPEARGVPPVFVEVPRGGVAFHHGLTIHVAKPNRSQRMRRVHTVIYFRDGSTRAERGAHPCVDRAEIRVGAPIDSDVTPLIWPRRSGDLPVRPSYAVGESLFGRHLWPR